MTRFHLIACVAWLMLSGCAHPAQRACLTSAAAEADIRRTIQAFFDALGKEDAGSFRRVTTSSFYAFDVGKRFVGTELVEVVREARTRGVQLNWSVGPLDTEIVCDVAWSAWENDGSAGIPPDVKPVRWLESAVLVRQDGAWKIDFFHSQRAAVP